MRVSGRYRLVDPVGQGGMGRVWRAADEMLDRSVAVKELRLDGGPGDEDPRTRRERALREARAPARVDHPGVVRVYDVTEDADRLWIVMELVDAPSLETVVHDNGPLDTREAARVGLALTEALRQVHAAGVLHRDIKPGNVLLGSGGRVVLTDFGIASLEDTRPLTRTGVLLGSPEYIPPERALSRPTGPPSDLWSLGATLCTALTGHSPFARASTAETLLAIVYEQPRLPADDCPLTPLLRRLLAKDPADRPDLDEIEAYLRGAATIADADAVGERATASASTSAPAPDRDAPGEPSAPEPPDRRSRLLVALLVLVTAAVAAVMIATVIRPGGETRLPDTSDPPTVAGTSRSSPSPSPSSPSSSSP
ncbi:serine/threonine protein kinase [Streptomyces ipomoeae]|uniref:non-specific serine/threonine protein kinase n=1 Tax=Streptomyces ipomoeae TaxID=103232 RepID=A0AAE8W8N8_9ACTN|nr:serine/threonine-protein kinase [Streptomyces ipomoeae]TQE38469.1 serine/threonine protein kinase [Streptomyces ipomoeae]